MNETFTTTDREVHLVEQGSYLTKCGIDTNRASGTFELGRVDISCDECDRDTSVYRKYIS